MCDSRFVIFASKLLLAAVLVVGISIPGSANAGACATLPGANLQLTNNGLNVLSIAPANAILNRVSVFGAPPPLICRSLGAARVQLLQTSHTTGQGCVFNTLGGNTCVLRGGDGLPVELLSFRVQ